MLTWYARGLPSQAIASETRLDRKRVLRALLVVRTALAAALDRIGPLPEQPEAGDFVPADRAALTIGIRFRLGRPTAEVVTGTDGRLVVRELRRRVPDLGLAERRLRSFSAIVVNGRLRHVTREDPHPPHGHAELGAFWNYLSQELAGRGGIRVERMRLYLAEYTWRYRWRRWPLERRVALLLDLIDPRRSISPMELWEAADRPDADRITRGPAT